ncbi:hypothetical protein L6452_09089 [Arctium lappa]|uniref:Uncharacterized protein n=1 Tax=Arctium lappa TaxID=4217 RepID=A0ACB9DJN2_ARCLA|nr:hypothetical protein L6452_09089 [Arctium lappa]
MDVGIPNKMPYEHLVQVNFDVKDDVMVISENELIFDFFAFAIEAKDPKKTLQKFNLLLFILIGVGACCPLVGM